MKPNPSVRLRKQPAIISAITENRSFLKKCVSFLAMAIVAMSLNTLKAQTGLQFNGTSQYATSGVTTATSVFNSSTFTIETWFKRNGTGIPVSTGSGGIAAAIPLVTKGTSEAETGPADVNYFLGINTAGNFLCADFEEARSAASPGLNHPLNGVTPIVNGTWYHAAVTYNGTKLQLYLNGILESELTVGQSPNAAVISPLSFATSIQSNGTTVQGFFNGVMDEIRIWNTALTQPQISANMNLELTSGTGLVGRWGLNEGAGTSAGNSIVANPSLSLVNTPTWVTGATPFNVAPNAPTALSATAANTFLVNLTWTDNASTETGFQIERSTTGIAGTYTLLTTTAANITAYADNSVTGNNQYCYRIRAINISGNSGYNGPQCATTPAEGANGLDLGASSAYVTYGASPGLASQEFTIELWFKRTGTGTAKSTGTNGITVVPLLTKGSPEADGSNVDANYILGIRSSDNVLAADFEEGTGSLLPGDNHPIAGTTPILNNVWYHAAATFGNNQFKLYLNGLLEASVTLAPTIWPQGQSIQHTALGTMLTSTGTTNGGGSTAFFQGVLDEARIWNAARSEAQIQGSINQELAATQAGLLGRWGLNETSGTLVHESTGTAIHGTVTGTGSAWVTPGAPFNITFTPPNAPTALTATPSSNTVIQLSWTDNSSNETGFEIEQSTTGPGGPFTLIATAAANTTSYSKTGLSTLSNYCYQVRAVRNTLASTYSNTACATTLAAPTYALDLGSAGAYVTFGVAAAVATPSYTVEAWFKRTGTGVANTTGTSGIDIIPIITKGSPEAEGSTVDANFILGIQSVTNVIAADFEEGTGSVSPGLNHPITGVTPVTSNVWHHAAVTFSGGIYSLYLDGNLEANTNLTAAVFPQGSSIQHAALGTMIGSTGTAAGKFQGVIDEARIWNNARTLAQIRSTINAEISGSQPGLLARWGLNEGTGTVVNETSGSGVTGTVTGSGYSWVTPGAPFNLVFGPSIVISGTPLAAFTGVPGTPSAEQSYIVSGSSLTNDIVITAPADYEISTILGGDYDPAITLLHTAGTVAPTTIYVRLYRTSPGTSSGNIQHTSPGATTMNVAVTGTAQNVSNTLVLQDGVNSYTGTRDTYIWDNSPATVRGADTSFIQDKNAALAPADERKSLLKFDLSGIPSGATIVSAQLQFYVGVEGQGFNMHRMLVPWDEATTTYASIGNRYFLTNNTDAETAVNANWPGVDTYVGPITITLPASTIQDWVNGTVVNNGWLMIGTDADDGQQLRSREHPSQADRPKLTVVYTTVPPVNLPPNPPTSPSPAHLGNAGSTSPNICVTVSDPEGSPLNVKFYGRKKTSSGNKFTIIGLPDTQFYTEEVQGTNSAGGGHNGIFKAQNQWISNHLIDSSIAFVVQLGDCVQNGDNPPGADKQIEWKRADTAFKIIENQVSLSPYGIPYGVCVGNHDQGVIGDPNSTNQYYNQYFGSTRFTGRTYYGGHFGTNNDNHYELFSGGGIDFIHISIEYYANGTTTSLQAVLDWADNLLKTYPNRKGIISSHNILGTGNPASFQGPGQKIYDELKDNANLILMLAGHVPGEGRRSDTYLGNTVHTLMSDYQSGYSNGGNGYLRIMQFIPNQNQISVKTYSPYSNTSFTGSGSQFTLPVNLTQAFTLIGTNNNVTSATQTCMNWPSLDPSSEYEWYVEVSDGVNTITSPIWSFTTPGNNPPVISTQPLPQAVCTGTEVTFISAATGTPAPTVQWQVSTDNGGTWNNVSGATTATYSFTPTISDHGHQFRAVWTNTGGSTNTNEVSLTVYALPVAGITSNNGLALICSVPSITLTASGGGTYLWSTGATTGSIIVNTPGLYSVTVTGTGGCVSTASVTVTQPDPITALSGPQATATDISCFGSANGSMSVAFTAQGGIAPYSYVYAWTGPGGYTASTKDISGLLPGLYQFTVTVTDNNNCSASFQTSASITEPPLLNLTLTATTNLTCAGNPTGSATVTATGGVPPYQYKLGNGSYGGSGTFNGLAAGNYTATVKDAHNCEQPVSFTITEPGNTDLTLGSDFTSNLFPLNGSEVVMIYNITEVAGRSATPVTLRIFKPAGYNIVFNNSLTFASTGVQNYTLDNANWTLTASTGLYVEYSRSAGTGNNTNSCGQRVNISFTLQRNTFNKSSFNLNVQCRQATSELILTNNTNSVLMIGE
ncbi:MAG: DNRLRE domain-containing protein [Chitinophagaceae bacterium]|nr:DNRLRE domain-containing protein [Chitinophagaceae bacterium]